MKQWTAVVEKAAPRETSLFCFLMNLLKILNLYIFFFLFLVLWLIPGVTVHPLHR